MNWVDAIQAKLPFLGPPEQRSEAQIDHDLEDEFAFHIEMRTRDLMSEGHTPKTARGIAIAQFGNIQSIKQQCKRIALKEHIMLQRVNFVMMIVVLILVGVVGVQVYLTQRQNTLALTDISAQIAKMRLDAAAEARERGWTLERGSDSALADRFAFVEGDVLRPGAFVFPLVGEFTLRRLITSCGGVIDNDDASITIRSLSGNASRVHKIESYLNQDGDLILEPNDHVYVARRKLPAPSAVDMAPTDGTWVQVTSGGEKMANGLMMEMIPPSDLRYQILSGPSKDENVGYIKFGDDEVHLVFNSDYSLLARLNGAPKFGRWTREQDQLLVALDGAFPNQPMPLRLVRNGEMSD